MAIKRPTPQPGEQGSHAKEDHTNQEREEDAKLKVAEKLFQREYVSAVLSSLAPKRLAEFLIESAIAGRRAIRSIIMPYHAAPS